MKRSMTHYSVNNLLLDWYKESHSPHPIQFKIGDAGEVFIYTPYPGYLIGKAGSLINKYREKFTEKFEDFSGFRLIEVHRVAEIKFDIMEDY